MDNKPKNGGSFVKLKGYPVPPDAVLTGEPIDCFSDNEGNPPQGDKETRLPVSQDR